MGKQKPAKKLPAKIASRWKEQRVKVSAEEERWAEIEEGKKASFKPMIQEPTGRKGKKDKTPFGSEELVSAAVAIGKNKKKKAKQNAEKSWT
jgi:hypothetical protein